MKKFIFFAVLIGSVAMASFFAGGWWATRNVKSYSVNGYTVCYNRNWPTYGLPLTDYSSVLTLLRSGNSNSGVDKMEALLDIALCDARARREQLQADSLARFDKAVETVAVYRERFPRKVPSVASTNDPDYQVVMQMTEADRFLEKFRK